METSRDIDSQPKEPLMGDLDIIEIPARRNSSTGPKENRKTQIPKTTDPAHDKQLWSEAGLEFVEIPVRKRGSIASSEKSMVITPNEEATTVLREASPETASNEDSTGTSKDKLWTRDFFVITLVNFLLFCGFQFFPSTLPLYVKELGGSDAIIGWVTGITTISALLIRPFSGFIVDRFGRKGVFMLSLLIMIGVSFSFAFFPVVGIILLIRFIHGLGWGLATTATSTIASDIIPRKRFGEGMGFFSLSASLAMALAPGIAISLFHSTGITMVCYLATGVLVCALLLAIIVKSPPIERPPKDATKWYAQVFEKNAVFPGLIMAFATFSYGAVITFIAVFAELQGIMDIGLFFTVYAVVILITRPFLGRIVDRRGANSVVIIGFIALAIGLVILSFSNALWIFLLCAVVYGFGYGSVHSGLQTLAVALAPPHRRGAANATFFIGFDGGLGLGCILSGIIAGFVGYSSMYLLYALLPIIAGVIFAIVRLRKKNA